MSQYCNNCDSETKEGNKFCTQCGTKYEEKKEQQSNIDIGKSIFLKYAYGEYLIGKTFIISIVLIILTNFFNYISFEFFIDTLILKISNFLYAISLIAISIPMWKSSTNFMGISYFWAVLVKLFSLFIIFGGIVVLIDLV